MLVSSALRDCGRLSFVLQRFSAESISLLLHAPSKCLEGETGHVFEAPQVFSFVTPAPQYLCWFPCPPGGAFYQGPHLDSQPLTAPRIGKWPQVESDSGYKWTRPPKASSLPVLFQAPLPGWSLFPSIKRLGDFTHSSIASEFSFVRHIGRVWGPSKLQFYHCSPMQPLQVFLLTLSPGSVPLPGPNAEPPPTPWISKCPQRL